MEYLFWRSKDSPVSSDLKPPLALQLKVQHCNWLEEGFYCTGVRQFEEKKGDVLGLHLDNKWGWVITAMTFFLKSVWAAAEHSEAQSLFN